jgi:hypothetical protein
MPVADSHRHAARWSAFDLACALFALAAAVAIYRGWRPHGGLWLNVPRTPFDASLAAFAGRHPIPSWTRYSLPDALWQYAFGATMGAVWRGAPWTRTKAAFIVAPAVLGLVVELGQGVGIVSGTFDVADLVASAVAALLAVVLHGGVSRRASTAATMMATASSTDARAVSMTR